VNHIRASWHASQRSCRTVWKETQCCQTWPNSGPHAQTKYGDRNVLHTLWDSAPLTIRSLEKGNAIVVLNISNYWQKIFALLKIPTHATLTKDLHSPWSKKTCFPLQVLPARRWHWTAMDIRYSSTLDTSCPPKNKQTFPPLAHHKHNGISSETLVDLLDHTPTPCQELHRICLNTWQWVTSEDIFITMLRSIWILHTAYIKYNYILTFT
jgi:hypothetical protein